MASNYQPLLATDDGAPVVIQGELTTGFRGCLKRNLSLIFASVAAIILFTIAGIIIWVAMSRNPSIPPVNQFETTVILISLDGFRAEYLYRNPENTVHLRSLAENGVYSKALQPVFPSKTFPNHYSIVTGLYPENHGIVSNTMYDPELGVFSLSNNTALHDPRWWFGEPIWNTMLKQGKRPASVFWPGSDVKIQGLELNLVKSYDGNMPHEDELPFIYEWLNLPFEERPTFISLYIDSPDKEGHKYGPNSTEVDEAIKAVDQLVGKLITQLKTMPIYPYLNIIVVSDHGMAEVSKSRAIYLDDYISLDQVLIVDYSPVLFLFPKPEANATAIYEALKPAPHMNIYWKEDIPARFHYNDSIRITPIVGIADDAWTITTKSNSYFPAGSHGYDNTLPDMQALFLAHGPSFKSQMTIDMLENINLYNIMCKILGVIPAPNNGTDVNFNILA